MTDRLQRLLAGAIREKRPVMVNPSADEIRAAAERLRLQGRLICSKCRRPIVEPEFTTARITYGPRLQAIAHLHPGCDHGTRSGSEGDGEERSTGEMH